jgi:hypothetical protein
MVDASQLVGRLALRVEGNWWVAYYAMPLTMADAIELGRVQMGLVQHPERKQAFMDLMKHAIAEFLEARTGQAPDFLTQLAPEHERSGRA